MVCFNLHGQKADPNQFLRIHGSKCRIHLDLSSETNNDLAALIPWQGLSDCMIDRFDARTHLDFIPPVKVPEANAPIKDMDERQLNYEVIKLSK